MLPSVTQITFVHTEGPANAQLVDVCVGEQRVGTLTLSTEAWEMIVTAMVGAFPGRVHVVDAAERRAGDVIDLDDAAVRDVSPFDHPSGRSAPTAPGGDPQSHVVIDVGAQASTPYVCGVCHDRYTSADAARRQYRCTGDQGREHLTCQLTFDPIG